MTTILNVPGTNRPNPFSKPIQTLLTPSNLSSAPTPDETAAQLVNSVTTSSDPTNALWEFWDAFFTAVATSPTSHDSLLALLDALHAQPPTELKLRASSSLGSYIKADGKLPLFSAQWCDVHDILEAWRDWDGVKVRCIIWVFYACRDVLEHEGPQPRQLKAHRMSSEQLWTLDVWITAIWMRDGGWALWDTDYDELRRHWAAALGDQTELWPREDGLTWERWRLWGERLQALSTERILDEETRVVVTEAAEVVSGILKDST
ncbi:hypothetical protein N7463_006981 [Penicillium fimorum]|uniref:Uncharacterized protein n=1 Tax=Penicillium fimorum TaxID=1882269 RepID=A0A9W9XVF8_9EURO|nr:hypothetical protein N7463_006981 [Penicillium fimorum]